MGSNGQNKRKTALITGASAGIGRELAREFAAGGFDLVVVARSEDKLQSLAEELKSEFGIAVIVLPKDLSKARAPLEIRKALKEQDIAIEVLVNNAGVTEMGKFHETDIQKLLQIVHVNIASLTALTRLFVEPMVERGSGRILNVASITSFSPVPSLAAYGASKAYVLSLTEALSDELHGTGVTATALCPGLTDTNMLAGAEDSHPHVKWVPATLVMDPERVAREGYRACMRGTVVLVPGVANQVVANWGRLYPRWVVRTVNGIVGRFAN